MTHILHLTCSLRGDASHSSMLSGAIVDRLMAIDPSATKNTRDLASVPFQGIDATYAAAVVSGKPDTDNSSPSLDASAVAITELLAADVIVIGTPMHNLTIPAALKAWIDLVVRAFHTFAPGENGKVGLVSDRPVILAIASGGVFQGENARQPDFLTPYLKAVLGCIGLQNIHVLALQGTARRSGDDLSRQLKGLITQVDTLLAPDAAA